MDQHATGHLTANAAEIYQRFFVPALFAGWPEQVLDAVGVGPGERVQAIREMLRVTRAGGRICIAVWAALEDTPGYQAMAELLTGLFGAQLADSIALPYRPGDRRQLESLCRRAGVTLMNIRTLPGKACFDSLEAWIYTEIRGWTLANVLDDDDYETLKRHAPQALSRFVRPDGCVEFDAPAHLVTIAR